MQMPLALSPRRAAVLISTLALLIAGALALANATGAVPTARLALVKMNPATVSGHGFRAHARVHLLLVADGTMSRAAGNQSLRRLHGHILGRDRPVQRMVG